VVSGPQGLRSDHGGIVGGRCKLMEHGPSARPCAREAVEGVAGGVNRNRLNAAGHSLAGFARSIC
jgi:hypothetical protein